MAITDASAIAFSNEQVRPTADKLARCYRKLKLLNQQWNASAGTNAQKWVIFQTQIMEVADYLVDAYFFIYRVNHQWNSLGMNSLFPNLNTELVYDNGQMNGQDTSRPPINGQDVQRLQSRWREWLAWMEKNAFDPASVNSVDYANLYAFSKLTRDGSKAPTQAQGVAVATTLAQALITQYETTAPSNLTHILAVAVNP